MDRKYERDALHGPWPTRPEELAAQYADRWTIYRELQQDGSHGGWVAKPHQAPDDSPEKITARDIEALADKLAAADPIGPEDLAKLYAGRWVIGRDQYPDGTYSDWYADPVRPGDVRYSAYSIGKLAEQLQRAAGGGRRG